MKVEPELNLSLCNEMLADEGFSFAEQAHTAKLLGYRGLELAPGTLGDAPHRLDDASLMEVRRQIELYGLGVTGLHWLLAPYPEASIVDPLKRIATEEILLALVDQCAVLGGSVLVHGSPSSRRIPEGLSRGDALDNAAAIFQRVAQRAGERGFIYCIEPLSRAETDFINTVEEGQALAERVVSPAFQTMIDTSAAGLSEDQPVAALVRQWVPSGAIGHIQVNDTNRGAPGTGDDPFYEIVRAIKEVGWDRPIAVEPFRSVVDATTTAAIGAATIRAYWNAP